MPTEYSIDARRGLVVSRAFGVLTEAESLEMYERLKSDEAFDPSYGQICDLSQVTDLQASEQFIRTLAHLTTFELRARRAFVAPHDLHFGLARMLEAFIESKGGEVGVFRSVAEAEAWLLESGQPQAER